MNIVIAIPLHLFKWGYPAPVGMCSYPVGPAYIAAALRAVGHSVRIADPNNTDFPDTRTAVVFLCR